MLYKYSHSILFYMQGMKMDLLAMQV